MCILYDNVYTAPIHSIKSICDTITHFGKKKRFKRGNKDIFWAPEVHDPRDSTTKSRFRFQNVVILYTYVLYAEKVTVHCKSVKKKKIVDTRAPEADVLNFRSRGHTCVWSNLIF